MSHSDSLYAWCRTSLFCEFFCDGATFYISKNLRVHLLAHLHICGRTLGSSIWIATFQRHKLLFTKFKQKGVWIEHKLLKKFTGSYDALWRSWMANVSKHCPDYARLPNQGIVDIDQERKLRAVHWDLSEFKNLVDLFVLQGMQIFILNASKEVIVPLLILILCVAVIVQLIVDLFFAFFLF
jgi:hypothetical protein